MKALMFSCSLTCLSGMVCKAAEIHKVSGKYFLEFALLETALLEQFNSILEQLYWKTLIKVLF